MTWTENKAVLEKVYGDGFPRAELLEGEKVWHLIDQIKPATKKTDCPVANLYRFNTCLEGSSRWPVMRQVPQQNVRLHHPG